MTPTLGGQLERVTLEQWTDQASLLDVARLYDVLRESLTLAYQDYRKARRRGWPGAADADKALAEVIDLVALLDVCAMSSCGGSCSTGIRTGALAAGGPGLVSTAKRPARRDPPGGAPEI